MGIYLTGRNQKYIWAKLIKRYGWFIILAVGMGLNAVGNFAYITSAFAYINLPNTDTTYHVTFANLTRTFAVFLSMALGTAMTKIMEGSALNVLGISLVSIQVLMLASGIGQILVSMLSVTMSEKLTGRKLP